MRLQIEAAMLEIDAHGDTLWVHSPEGATVLRIKSERGFEVVVGDGFASFIDVRVEGPILICVAKRDSPDGVETSKA